MPILKRETNLYPDDLLTGDGLADSWYLAYTKPNREKDLMRRLLAMKAPFYCPIIKKTSQSPSGRLRQSFIPLFSNYLFVQATDEQRYDAMTTNCIVTLAPIADSKGLTRDLQNLEHLITAGQPVSLEEKLQPGQLVRIRTGAFTGCEGTIVERRGARRLLVAVNFLQQGASVELDDFTLESL